jgi:DNA-binding transcriptional LysR family regulator
VVRLEEELGVRLFHRSTRAVTLTAEGSLFLERCQRILAEFDVARTELTRVSAAPQGRLRIGLPQLSMYLIPHMVAFQQAHPRIELELSFGDRLVNIIDEGFDAVIRIGTIDDSRLTVRQLGGYTHRLVAAPAYLAQRGTPARPTDLVSHACLRYRFPTSGKLAPWPLAVRGRPLTVELPESSIADATEPLKEMAEAGLGIALLPDFLVADAIAAGRLAVVLERHVDDHRAMCILWPSSRQSLPKIKAFVDFMVARLGKG